MAVVIILYQSLGLASYDYYYIVREIIVHLNWVAVQHGPEAVNSPSIGSDVSVISLLVIVAKPDRPSCKCLLRDHWQGFRRSCYLLYTESCCYVSRLH